MWSKTFVERIHSTTAFLSVVFTWDLPKALKRAQELEEQGYSVIAGGPAVYLMPEVMGKYARTDLEVQDAIAWHNPQATFTSRGCVRACSFCAVPKLEGKLQELQDWPVRPIVCDNNLLACSKPHFDSVIDKTKLLPERKDFNQGLDARLMTKHHASRLAEIDCMVRLAFDSVAYEQPFLRAYQLLRNERIPKRSIQVYVLIGYDDTPEDALYRLRVVDSLGSLPNPMRYQPLDTTQKNSYVGPAWTNELLNKYMRYWSRLRYTRGVPFEEFDTTYRRKNGNHC